jgi:hypothetical protein
MNVRYVIVNVTNKQMGYITIRLAIKYTYEHTKKTYNNINVYKDTINFIELNVKCSYI